MPQIEGIQHRDYQISAFNACRKNVSEGVQTQVLQLATGAGKTHIASMIAKSAVAKGNRVYFIVDQLELVDQTASRFHKDGLEVGVIQAHHEWTDYGKPVQVATIQTLRHRWHRIISELKPDVVIIDECHVIHKAHVSIIKECRANNVPVIGLSATPFKRGLGTIFDKLVIGATTADLTPDYLCETLCYAPYIPNLKGIKKKSNGDWQEDELGEFMGEAKIVGDVVKNWKKLGNDRQTLVFACNVAHSKALRDAFLEAGVNAAHIDGYEQDKRARAQKIQDFKDGKIQVLCNVAVLTKGFDAPSVSCLVVARPTKSLMLHIQILGRGLRKAEGKENCIIIDHAGNLLRNGLPTDDLPEELCDGTLNRNLDRKKREKKEVNERPCKECGFIKTSARCPSCGHVTEFIAHVEGKDGELRLLDTAALRNKHTTPEQKTRFYGELLQYADDKGYSEGWAKHTYRKRFGVWPNKYSGAKKQPVSEDTRNFIVHRQIAYAKRVA